MNIFFSKSIRRAFSVADWIAPTSSACPSFHSPLQYWTKYLYQNQTENQLGTHEMKNENEGHKKNRPKQIK